MVTSAAPMSMLKLDVWHNIMWSRYKARVLSELYALATQRGVALRIFQIAETEHERQELGAVDHSAHVYPLNLLFKGSYSDIPRGALLFQTASKVLRSHADVVLVAGYHRPEYILQILLARLTGKKVAVFCDSTIHDHPQTPLKSLIKRLVFAQLTAAFCYGDRSAEYLHYHGMSDARIIRRCQAADVDDGLTPQQRLLRRERLRAGRAGPQFLFVGRLAPEKGLDTLLLAFAELHASEPSSTLRIVGQGPLHDTLDAKIQALGLQESVTLVGPCTGQALWDEYARACALVLPSRSEPWGLVVNEALSYGCHVIVSDRCGCVPELVLEGQSGQSFPVDNVPALAAAMRKQASKDPAQEAQQAAMAQNVVAPYTAQAAALSILDGCARILEGDRNG